MSDISLNGSSIDDWFNDSDYNPNSPIEVSEFENISDYSDYENVMIKKHWKQKLILINWRY